MAIADDFSVAANGDIRYVGDAHGGGSPGYYTVIDFHRWLQDLADDAVASGDDLLDITDLTPSERSTDNIIDLKAPYNIDDTAAEHLYDGSISQASGATVYSGLVVVGAVTAGTNLQIVQDNTLLTSYWGSGLNADATQNILLRVMVKTRDSGSDIDGKRLRVQARELGDTYAEFSLTAGLGNATAAIFTANDLNNATDASTISGWTSATYTEGFTTLDIGGNGDFYIEWTKGTQTINELYERAKWVTRRGTSETIFGLNGELFRGPTHQFDYDNEANGPFSEEEELSWGSGATAGTGTLLALDDQGTTGTMWIQLLTGVAPSDGLQVSGATATADVNGTVTTRTVPGTVIGASTGSSIIGAYGVGISPDDLTASDQLFDLTNTLHTPPNNVEFKVLGLVSGEDYVLVGPATGQNLNTTQLSLSGTYSGGETSVVVNEAIPGDTPTAGTIRVWNGNTFSKVTYTGWGTSTFTGCSGMPAASANDDVFISYIDTLAGSDQESFTGVYQSNRDLFVRVRDGGGTPIKTFETTGTLGSAGGSTTAIRTSDV